MSSLVALASPIAPVTPAKIISHQFTHGKPTIYKVLNEDGTVSMVPELEMNVTCQELLNYKLGVSGLVWENVKSEFWVDEILSHRWVDGTLYYWVSFSDDYSHPIFNCEFNEEQLEWNIQPKEKIFLYNVAYGIEDANTTYAKMTMKQERDTARYETDICRERVFHLTTQRDQLKAEKDEIVAENVRLQQKLLEAEAALQKQTRKDVVKGI